MKIDFNPTTNGKKIGEGIEKFGAIVSGAMEMGHKLAASVALHAAIHGDTTLADRLVTACGEGFRKNALRQWLTTNGPFGWAKKDGEKPAHFTLSKDKQKALVDEVAASNESAVLDRLVSLKNGWEKTPEAPFQGFDLLEVLQGAVKKAGKYKDESDPSRKAKINIRGVQHLERAIEAIIAERGQTLQ